MSSNGVTQKIIFNTKMVILIINNKYRVLRSCDGDHLNQRVPGDTDRTEGMAMISGMNQLGPQKVKVKVS